MPILSIIVPVYNAEKYLPACLGSLAGQDVKDCEFILVNDGSTDGSLAICRQYAEKDNRFKVFTKTNGGQASARNLGLDNAKGKYIGFMDSDDVLLDPISYKYAIDILERQPEVDIVQFPYFKIAPDGTKVASSYTGSCDLQLVKPKQYFEAVEIISNYCQNPKKLSSAQWDKIFRDSVFKNLRYPDGRIYEDTYLTCDLFQRASSIILTAQGGYGYYTRENSTTTATHSARAYRNQLDANIRVLQFLIANDGDIPMAKTVYKELIRFIVNCSVAAGPVSNYNIQINNLAQSGKSLGVSTLFIRHRISLIVLAHKLKNALLKKVAKNKNNISAVILYNILLDSLLQGGVTRLYSSKSDLLLTIPKEYFETVEVVTDYCGEKRKLSSGQCDKIFRREMFDGLRYPEGRIFEDTYLSCDLFQRARSIMLTGMGGYGYYIRESSTTTSKRTIKAYQDQLDSQIRVLKFLIVNGGDKKIIKLVQKKLVKFIINCGVATPPLDNYNSQLAVLYQLGKEIGAHSFPNQTIAVKWHIWLHNLKRQVCN